jgi:serine/threonine protein kinase
MSDADGTWPWAVGTSLAGRYRLDALLHVDATVVVYRALDTRQRRLVTVEARKDNALDLRGTGRFEQALASLRTLEHPNIAAIVEQGSYQRHRYLVMDWFEGESLQRRIAHGPLAAEAALAIVRQLLAALACVHGAGLVHGNLHPGSVFLQRLRHGLERVKLCQFGFANVQLPPPPAAGGEHGKQLSDAAAAQRAFAAPELGQHGPPSPRSDVFSVGVLLAELLVAGRAHAKAAASLSVVVGSAAAEPVASLEPSLRALLARATAAAPSERFSDAAEMLCALIDALPRPVTAPIVEDAASDVPSASLELATSPQVAAEVVLALPVLELAASEATQSLAPAPGSPNPRAGVGARPLLAASMLGAVALLLAAYMLSMKPWSATALHAPLQPRLEPLIAPPTVSAPSNERALHTELSAITRADTPASQRAQVAPPTPEPVAAAGAPSPKPATHNPWLAAVPAGLQGVPAYVATGGRGDEAMVRSLRDYSRDNPSDPRGYLLLGRLYCNRLWRADCVSVWTLALRRDLGARGAPELLPALIQLVMQGKDADAAAALIAEAYGREAAPALEAAAATLKKTEALARVRALQARVGS